MFLFRIRGRAFRARRLRPEVRVRDIPRRESQRGGSFTHRSRGGVRHGHRELRVAHLRSHAVVRTHMFPVCRLSFVA